jgi:uncharacterized protein DUF4191
VAGGKPEKAQNSKAAPSTGASTKAPPSGGASTKAAPSGGASTKAAPTGGASSKATPSRGASVKGAPSKTAQSKAVQKEAKAAKRAESKARRRQIWEAFKMQRKEDKALIPWMLGAFLACVVVVTGIGWFFGVPWLVLPIGIAVGALAAISIFGRRVQRSVYAKAEGQPGAAGWSLDNMRGRWRVTQGVAGTTHLDAVHRVIGRPGVILVAEGAPHRVKTLLAQEKKRTARVAGTMPIYDVIVGNEEGQVPLKKLQRHLMKLPRNISAKEMDTIEARLAALGSRAAALPKGPLPAGAKMRSVQRTARRR